MILLEYVGTVFVLSANSELSTDLKDRRKASTEYGASFGFTELEDVSEEDGGTEGGS